MPIKGEGASILARGDGGWTGEAPSKPANARHEGMTIGGWPKLEALARSCQLVRWDNEDVSAASPHELVYGLASASGRLNRTAAPPPA